MICPYVIFHFRFTSNLCYTKQGGQGDAVQFSTETQSLRLGPGSATFSRLPAVKAPPVDDGINEEKCMAITGAEAFTSKCESLNMKGTSMSDQKTLKVRIKMGLDNLPTRKNAAIYSGLGLDMSPTSSQDGSPSESEGISRGPQDASFESPTSILQVNYLPGIRFSLIFFILCLMRLEVFLMVSWNRL